MGCVSSALLNQQHEDFGSRQLGGGSSSSFGHHIVCLTSSTYGRLLSLDPPSPPPISSSEPEIINSWELMAGLDLISNNNNNNECSSFRGFKKPFVETIEDVDDDEDKKDKENLNANSNQNPNAVNNNKSSSFRGFKKPFVETVEDVVVDDDEDKKDKENLNSNSNSNQNPNVVNPVLWSPSSSSSSDVGIQSYCSKMKVACRPPKGGEDKVVVYTTSLGTVRKTLEECKAVKAVLKGMGVSICERDISMDIGWRQELKDLLLFLNKDYSNSNTTPTPIPPQVFIKGRYLGGGEEFMRIAEQGLLPDLLQGLPKFKFNTPLACCNGCGGVRFVPCLSCNGSCKKLLLIRSSEQDLGTTTTTLDKHLLKDTTTTSKRTRSTSTTSTLIVQCPHCNENGLMLCPICS